MNDKLLDVIIALPIAFIFAGLISVAWDLVGKFKSGFKKSWDKEYVEQSEEKNEDKNNS